MTFGFSASFVWVAAAAAALGKEQAAAKKNRTRQEIPEMSVFAATIFDRSLSWIGTIPILCQQRDWVGVVRKMAIFLTFSKVRTFWEAHKNLRNLPHAFNIYLVSMYAWGWFFQILCVSQNVPTLLFLLTLGVRSEKDQKCADVV